jgi:hypothetical protein
MDIDQINQKFERNSGPSKNEDTAANNRSLSRSQHRNETRSATEGENGLSLRVNRDSSLSRGYNSLNSLEFDRAKAKRDRIKNRKTHLEPADAFSSGSQDEVLTEQTPSESSEEEEEDERHS